MLNCEAQTKRIDGWKNGLMDGLMDKFKIVGDGDGVL